MAKDPAFLFYSDDFLAGTYTLTDKQVGQYIRLLCLQHQQGHLSEKQIKSICKTKDEAILSKFIQDEAGLYYNVRLEKEATKRSAYCESRRRNKTKKDEDICPTYDSKDGQHMSGHMGNGNINRDIKLSTEDKEYVEDYTARNAEIGRVIAYYQDGIGNALSSQAANEIPSYIDFLSANVVIEAIGRAIKGGDGSWRYARKILNDWKTAGIKSLAELNRHEGWKKKPNHPAGYGGADGGDKEGDSL